MNRESNPATRRCVRLAALVVACALPAGCSESSPAGDATGDGRDGDAPPDADSSGDEGGADADVDGDGGDVSDVPPEVPPRICRDPVVLPDDGAFVMATDEMRLDAANLHVLGNRIASADIDGDGYPDLIVHRIYDNLRDDPTTGDPTTRMKRVFLNRPGPGGGRTLEEWTVQARYGQTRDGSGLGRSAQLAVFADVDNDGDLDVFSGTYVNASSGAAPDPGDRSEILLNDGTGVFELAPQSDVSPSATSKWSTTGASFVDYDRDGNVDVFVGFWYRVYGYLEALQDRLYRGNGDGTFDDVTDAAHLTTTRDGYEEGTNHRPTYGVTACDVDSDGDGDLLVSAYGRSWNMLWENLGDGAFRDIAPMVGFDADDVVDYFDNEFYRCWCRANPGSCDPDPPAPRISCGDYWQPGSDDRVWRSGGNTFSTACGDADNDGDMDLLSAEIRHWHIGASSDPSELLENVPDAGELGWTFERPGNATNGLARTWGSVDWNEGDIFVAFVDFDNDGLKDAYLASTDYPGTRGFLFHREADGTYREMGRAQGVGHPGASGMTWADFDRDGDLDLVVGSATARSCCGWTENEVHYYRNQIGQDGNWIQVVLRGSGPPGASGSAVGARVTVTAGGVSQVQELGGGYGHMAMQHDLVLHFGLGAACDVDSIEVRWPDAAGSTQTFTGVRGDYRVRIVQGTPWVEYVLE